MNGIEREYGRRLNVLYVSMDEQEGLAIGDEYGVIGTPTILLLDETGTTTNILRGIVAEEQLTRAVDALLEQ